MDLYLLDKKYDTLGLIDIFKSFTWVERYRGAGEMEIQIPADSEITKLIQDEYYIYNTDSDRLMFVDEFEVDVSSADGNFLIIKGESLESLLKRRVVWETESVEGSLQDAIVSLLNENIVSPKDDSRRIPGFRVRYSIDAKVLAATLDPTPVRTENLYDIVDKLCKINRIGWRVLPDWDNVGFIFELYAGVDHSYAQDKEQWVLFSKEFDNLRDSRFWISKKDWMNACLIDADGYDGDIVTTDVSDGYTGLNRREMYMQSTEVQFNRDNVRWAPDSPTDTDNNGYIDENEMSTWKLQIDLEKLDIQREYDRMRELMKSEASIELDDHTSTSGMDGEVASEVQFHYGVDYGLGDIVQVENEYGRKMTSRVTEYAITWDSSGLTYIPTFTSTVDEDEEIEGELGES